MDVRVLFNEKYNTVPGGTIENVTFKNVSYQSEGGDMYPMRIMGYDEKSVVRNILFENVILNGNKMKSIKNVEMNEFVEDIFVK